MKSRWSLIFTGSVVAVLTAATAAPQPAGAAVRSGAPSRSHSPAESSATLGAGVSASSRLCSLPKSNAANIRTECSFAFAPHNETAIVVNPRNDENLVASANDTELTLSGGQVVEVDQSYVRTSFDGGHTWTDYSVPYYKKCLITGDPTLAFDAAGTVYLGQLCFNNTQNPDVIVTHSDDSGRTWSPESTVIRGTGTFTSAGLSNDHPQLTAWGDGNVIVTWVAYRFDNNVNLITAPVVVSVSHDSGHSWSAATDVSGSAPFCKGLVAAHSCDQTWGNAVAVSSHNIALVTFYDTDLYRSDGSTNLDRTKHMVVSIDPETGKRIGGPYLIGQAYDGLNTHDYPESVAGRQTLHDSEFRLLMQGNIAADPTDPRGRHFAVVWYDDRNAPHPVNADPYKAITNSDIIVSQTFDGGLTWNSPQAIREPGDQFMPWATYDSTGRLRIDYFDRSYDTLNHSFGFTLATEQRPGSLQFFLHEASTALSDPTQDDRWYATTVNTNFPNATTFVGDYSGIAAIGSSVIVYWTDMRQSACFQNVCGHGQNTLVALMR
jgi:hypothetical protein